MASYNSNNIKNKTEYLTKSRTKSLNSYTRKEYIVIILTVLITILGLLLRTWRILREGMPLAFDGFFYLRVLKNDFFNGWINLSELTRDPPGFSFIIIMTEFLLGLAGKPLMGAIYIFPQIISGIQLIIYYVLARRLMKSRMIGLLSMLFVSCFGLMVYRNQNIAPETIVLGLVPFVVFYILRYFETKDLRYLILALLITVGITFVHHLTTLIVLALWHILFPYNIIYRRFGNNGKFVKKDLILDIGIIITLDAFVFLFWQIVLKGFPLNFIESSFKSLFPEGESSLTVMLMIIAVFILNAVVFSIFFYNFNRKKVNIAIVASGIIGGIIMFIIALFFGASSPDTNVSTGLVLSTQALTLIPLAAIGVIALPNNSKTRSRIIRGWLFSVILVISVTAIFPIMSSLLSRLALYVVGVALILVAIAVIKFYKKINKRSLKAVALIGLSIFMATSMSYSYPSAENNWGTQEVFWDAEFSSIDFFILYADSPNETLWSNNWEPKIDCDFRYAAILEGLSGMDSVFDNSGQSWLRLILFANESTRINYATNLSPKFANQRIDYIVITEVSIQDGFIKGWAIYGEDNDNWVLKFPDISSYVPLNPNINRIYDSVFAIVLLPF